MIQITIESIEAVTGFKIAMICKDMLGEVYAFEKNAEIDRNHSIEFYRNLWRAPTPNAGEYRRLPMLEDIYKTHDWEIPIYTTTTEIIGRWYDNNNREKNV